MPKVLFLASHREGRAPNQRYRFEQYLPYLRQHGFETELSPIVSAEDDRILYSPGHVLQKTLVQLRAIRRRLRDLRRAASFDVVFVCREALMLGTSWFERRIKQTGVPMLFDFDDAIWLLDVSAGNRRLAFLKNPAKTAAIIAMSDRIFAGNEYLATYARRFNESVTVVPSTVETDEYVPGSRHLGAPVVIGWSGSPTTVRYFEHAIPVLRDLRARYGDRIQFRLVGDEHYRNEELGIQGVRWSKETEIRELQGFDIGIMPMADEEWAKGKCGLKGLLYMSVEVPAVLSPHGVNSEIVQNGVNGYLAGSHDDWVDRLSRLVESPDLRERLGVAGRRTVIQRYSVRSQRDRYVAELDRLAELRRQRLRRPA